MKSFLLALALSLSTLSNAQLTGITDLVSYGGLPKVTDTAHFKILYNSTFITGYSESLKSPLWTVFRLGNTKGTFDEKKVEKWERPETFKTDVRTSAKVAHDDYTSTGFDRGHMAPNNSILVNYGQMAQLETFLMSNICPQNPNLNQGIWKKLEDYELSVLSQIDEKNKQVTDLYVICGPIYDKNPEMLKTGIAIPTHFYRILVYAQGYGATPKAVAFIFPQNPDGGKSASDFLAFATTVDTIETLTHINFFALLTEAKQKNIESIRRNFKLEPF